jgi:hypothetical protein
MNMTLLIDSVDFSSYLPKHGYTVLYTPVLGPNSCYTLDGSFHEDVLAYKALVTTELKPMTPEQLAAITVACQNCKYATYLDTKTNQVVTKKAKATLSPATVVLNNPSQLLWNRDESSGIIMTIEEL